MTTHDLLPGHGITPDREGAVTMHTEFLGRAARTGIWEDLARGTFAQAAARAREQRFDDAVALVEVSLLEAQELREVYEQWPEAINRWLRDQGIAPEQIIAQEQRLRSLIGDRAMSGIEAAWPAYASAAQDAVKACSNGASDAESRIEHARLTWQRMHDEAVDRVSGLIDVVVRLLGEHRLVELWDRLLEDWYDIHARRYSLDNQNWETSAHQLMVSIVDGFHAHLAGTARQGDIELVRETDRIGFRFAPCGSGGRAVAPEITDGAPRSGMPFAFAVTTEKHDWAWNTVGICSYCVHCCLLNEVMPIDRLGYPTRVIDPPVWRGDAAEPTDTACTWWVYRHPSLVPDSVYARVGRTPDRRPAPPHHRQSSS